jgi:hypothetical protein
VALAVRAQAGDEKEADVSYDITSIHPALNPSSSERSLKRDAGKGCA